MHLIRRTGSFLALAFGCIALVQPTANACDLTISASQSGVNITGTATLSGNNCNIGRIDVYHDTDTVPFQSNALCAPLLSCSVNFSWPVTCESGDHTIRAEGVWS